VIAEAPYLRNLAALVLLGTTGAALVDYLFKAQVLETFGRGDHLLRFFALYYAVTSVITFIIQLSSSRAVLERFGLGVTASTPSWALLGGSLAGLVVPGLGSLVAARGGSPSSGARSTARDTNCSTRRFRRRRSGPPSR
jgi:hypothetical protein